MGKGNPQSIYTRYIEKIILYFLLFTSASIANLKYTPTWDIFNIQRVSSERETAHHPFSLFTQIVGRDFDFSVVFYDKYALEEEKILKHPCSMEIELINASTNIRIKEAFTNASTFITMSAGISRYQVINHEDLRISSAIQNTAFRLWLLYDDTQHFISHPCKNTRDAKCFANVYKKYFSTPVSDSILCESCINPKADTDDSCYRCLREHFGHAIYSRDNFAIRPVGFSISIYDSNASKISKLKKNLKYGSNTYNHSVILNSGYAYGINVEAMSFIKDKKAASYTAHFDTYPSTQMISELRFVGSTKKCIDIRDHHWEIHLPQDKKVNTLHSHHNVGEYRYHISDKLWTIVDQEGFVDKPFIGNDCIPNKSTLSSLSTQVSGCDISSHVQNSNHKMLYYDKAIHFKTLHFDISTLKLHLPTNTPLFINDAIDDIRYQDMSAQIKGWITALDSDGHTQSNFTQGCASESLNLDIDINLTQKYTHKVIHLLRYDKSTQLLSKNIENNNSLRIHKNQFLSKNLGSTYMHLFYNFTRDIHQVSPPIQMKFLRKRISVEHNSSIEPLKSANITTNSIEMNDTVNFVYARVRASKSAYDDITQDTVTTPILIDMYCDNTVMDCMKHLFDTNTSALTSKNWWLANHIDYSPPIVLKPHKQMKSLHFSSSVHIPSYKGYDDTIYIRRDTNIHLPFTTKIAFFPHSAPYLHYKNTEDYSLTFIDNQSPWTGEGIDHEIDKNSEKISASQTQMRRLNW